MIGPDRSAFEADPIGYSGMAWLKWQTAMMLGGATDTLRKTPTKEDLKSPILWLSQANALSEAAKVLIESRPSWQLMPPLVRGVSDCQFCAVALMLVGYSLETCLKAMHILTHGIDAYIEQEKNYFHHDLVELAKFFPSMSDKDRAILKALTHFTMWAGRYPDPGSRRLDHATEIFDLSEKYQISGHDLFALSARVMKHITTFTSK